MRKISFYLLIFSFSCQRSITLDEEISSAGFFQKDFNGNCKPVIIAGNYSVAQNLNDSNYIEAEVNITSPGSYLITTDTVNGYFFKATGTFTTEGLFTIKLPGFGKPVLADTDHFIIKYNSSICEVYVHVTDTGKPASFSFEGAPNVCMNDTVYGSYIKGITLDTSAKVKISLNVTTPGTYSITTNTVNSYKYSSSGTFSSTGNQTILLSASGTPVNSGTDVFTVTTQNSSCSFSVNVLLPVVVNNNDHYPLTDNSYWTYDNLLHPGDTIKRMMADTITLDSNVYKVVKEDVKFGGPYEYYLRKNNDDYFEYAAPNKFTTFFQYKNPVYAEIPFLKENLTSGTVWSSPEYIDTATDGNVFTIRYDFNCTDAHATVALNGKAFTEVYKITMFALVKLTGQSFNRTGEQYLFYYAKGVGLIYMQKTLSGFIQTEWRIKNWQVN